MNDKINHWRGVLVKSVSRKLVILSTVLLGSMIVQAGSNSAHGFSAEFDDLYNASCVSCHSSADLTPLNLRTLSKDLSNRRSLQTWTRIYDRVTAGEMPPKDGPKASDRVIDGAMHALKTALLEASISSRGEGRTPLRRLTQTEYAYTLMDLLGIEEEIALQLSATLPAEADSGGFDTLAKNQGISGMHVRSYLAAADKALDHAIQLGSRPKSEKYVISYKDSGYLKAISEGKYQGGGITLMRDDSAVMFFEPGSTYTMHSDSEGFKVTTPGKYRIEIEAYPYQAWSPVTLTVYRGIKQGVVASLDDLIGSFDLIGEAPRTVQLETYLKPGQLISPNPTEVDYPKDWRDENGDGAADNSVNYYAPENNVRTYKGEGIAMKSMVIEGPITETWPPQSTQNLMKGVNFSGDCVSSAQLESSDVHSPSQLDMLFYSVVGPSNLSKIEDTLENLTPDFLQDEEPQNCSIILENGAYEHIVEIVEEFAPRAFRRPVDEKEIQVLASLAKPILAEERPFLDALRVPLRAILSSPSFLYQSGKAGDLDEYSLASRLSYFLWRSVPDKELTDLANQNKLADQAVLRQQVKRMLADSKSQRFVKDFVGQAYRLNELKATSPDKGLYPEYDDRLGQAMQLETELFIAELVSKNLSLENLVDADFTFLNRRLAEHYQVDEVKGQYMRRVALSPQSLRGGLLSQAAIHKITANGTTTSPVPRGNFVLTNLLGQPSPPPPPGVAGLEPDTRGTTTIREQLSAHRSMPVCASCHTRIDPPGFALEEFDPIGMHRTNYRVHGGFQDYDGFTVPMPHKKGLAVDASSITPEGRSFAGYEQYIKILKQNSLDQIARHFVSQLVAFGTGAEVSFADRAALEKIVEEHSKKDYPMQSVIASVVDSSLFRKR